MKQQRKQALIAAAVALLIPMACAAGGGNADSAPIRPTLSPDQQATGTAGAATAVFAASLPDFDPNQPTPEPPPPPGEGADSDEFVEELTGLLAPTDRDYQLLATYMGGEFTIVVMGDTPSAVSPAEAAEILSLQELTPDNELTVAEDADLTAILGQSPEEFFGGCESCPLTTGWGPDGTDEGILIIRERNDTLVWDGVLLQRGGFER